MYQWYLDNYRYSLRSTSGILMTIGKVIGLPVVSGWLSVGLRYTIGLWMTIGKVYSLPVVSG